VDDVLRVARVGRDRFDDRQQAPDRDPQVELLGDLAAQRVAERLPEAHPAAGQQPVPLAVAALLDHEQTAVEGQETPYTNSRTLKGGRGVGRALGGRLKRLLRFVSVHHTSSFS
jgi:hypothetical protein